MERDENCVERSFNAYLRGNVRVRSYIQQRFIRWGLLVSSARGILVVLFILVLTAGAGVGYLWRTEKSDMEKLWVPQDSQAMKDYGYVQTNWNVTRMEGLIVEAKNKGDDVLTKEALTELMALHNRLNTLKDSTNTTLSDLCIKLAFGNTNQPCQQVNVLGYWNFSQENIDNDKDYHSTVSNPNAHYYWGQGLNRTTVLGEVMFENSTGKVKKAIAMRILYVVSNNNEDQQSKNELWEKEVFLNQTSAEFKHIVVYRSSGRSISDEVKRTSESNGKLYVISYLVMLAYTAISLGHFSLVKFKSLLAIGGIFTIICALVFAYGIGSWIIFQTTLNTLLPFIMVGIGVDNIFIMKEFFTDTPSSWPLEKRLSVSVSKTGITMFFACTINVIAFILGMTSVLPGVQSFSVYAALAVIAIVFYELSMFLVFFYWDELRIFSGRMDVFPCIKLRKGGIDQLNSAVSSPHIGAQGSIQESHKENLDRSFVRRMVEDYYGPFLMKKWTKAVIIIIFLGLLAFGVYGSLHVQQKFLPQDLVPNHSYVADFLEKQAYYFQTGDYLMIVLKNFDYSTHEAQAALLNLSATLDASRWIQPPVSSWYDDYYLYLNHLSPHKKELVNGFPPNRTAFYDWLEEFLHIPQFSLLRGNIHFMTRNDTVINAHDYFNHHHRPHKRKKRTLSREIIGIDSSKFDTSHVPLLTHPADAVNAMLDTRKQVNGAGGGIVGFPFQMYYVFYEQNLITKIETIKTMGIAAAAVFVASFLFLYHPSAALIVTTLIVLIDVELLGWMWLLGIDLNAVSMIEIIMAVGLSVDYCVHIAFCFVISKQESKDLRAINSLAVMGTAILGGGFSSFLGVVTLAFATAKVFRVLFLMFLGIIILSVLHGLVLLPVLLSLFGPGVLDSGLEEEDDHYEQPPVDYAVGTEEQKAPLLG